MTFHQVAVKISFLRAKTYNSCGFRNIWIDVISVEYADRSVGALSFVLNVVFTSFPYGNNENKMASIYLKSLGYI